MLTYVPRDAVELYPVCMISTASRTLRRPWRLVRLAGVMLSADYTVSCRRRYLVRRQWCHDNRRHQQCCRVHWIRCLFSASLLDSGHLVLLHFAKSVHCVNVHHGADVMLASSVEATFCGLQLVIYCRNGLCGCEQQAPLQ